MKTLSFVVLRNNYCMYGPYTAEFEELDKNVIYQVLRQCPEYGAPEYGRTGLFGDKSKYDYRGHINHTTFYSDPHLVAELLDDLMNDGYSVWNRVEKYYSVVFAVNYIRPYVYSKEAEPKPIDWEYIYDEEQGIDVANGNIVGGEPSEEDTMNPVAKLLRYINSLR